MKTWMLVGAFGALAGCVDDVQVAKRDDAGTTDSGLVDAGDAGGGIDVLDVPDVFVPPDVRVATDVTTDRVNTDNGGCDGGGFCNADFPCGGRRFSCTNNVRWQRLATRDCSFRCGCTPCAGESCELDGPEERCPDGMMCTVVPLANDARETPCGPPASTEDVAVRTARVRSLLVGTWRVGRFGPDPESARFVIELRADGSVATRCIVGDVTCSAFGVSVPGAGGTLRTVVLEEMQFSPSTESISSVYLRVTPADGGATDLYQFDRPS
jgi:hypothetical protein